MASSPSTAGYWEKPDVKRQFMRGSAGYIGSHLTNRLLTDGYEVTGIDCFTDYIPGLIKEATINDAQRDRCFTFPEQDIQEMNEYQGVDYIFHEAAQAGILESWDKFYYLYP